MVLENKNSQFRQCILAILLLSPLWNERGPLFDHTWFPCIQQYFVPSLVEIGPVVVEKKLKMWKDYGQTDSQISRRTRYNMRSEKLTKINSSFAKKKPKIIMNTVKTNNNDFIMILNDFIAVYVYRHCVGNNILNKNAFLKLIFNNIHLRKIICEIPMSSHFKKWIKRKTTRILFGLRTKK